jgi:2-C-methyl-D-erythritol 4-phosphate cytidylyltransferase
MTSPVVAVVPIAADDGRAAGGPPAFRELDGVPLLRRAVAALAAAAVVERVVVACPAALAGAAGDLILAPAGASWAPVDVVACAGPGAGHRLRTALADLAGAPGRPVVVHDALHPLATAELVCEVVEVLRGAPPEVAAVVPTRPVTDTLKLVGEDDVVRATADREGFRMVYSPQAHRLGPLTAALASATDDELGAGGADVLPRLVQRAGGRLLAVPAPGEVFRIATAEDVALAEAMLQVRAAHG